MKRLQFKQKKRRGKQIKQQKQQQRQTERKKERNVSNFIWFIKNIPASVQCNFSKP